MLPFTDSLYILCQSSSLTIFTYVYISCTSPMIYTIISYSIIIMTPISDVALLVQVWDMYSGKFCRTNGGLYMCKDLLALQLWQCQCLDPDAICTVNMYWVQGRIGRRIIYSSTRKTSLRKYYVSIPKREQRIPRRVLRLPARLQTCILRPGTDNRCH